MTRDILRRQRTFSRAVAVIALLLAGITTWERVDALTAVPFFRARATSVASILSEITFVTTLIITALSFRRFLPREELEQDHLRGLGRAFAWVIRLAVALASGIVGLVIAVLVFSVLAVLLPSFSIAPPLVAALVALYAGLIAYTTARSAGQIGTLRLLLYAAFIMLTGLLVSVALSSNLDWWTRAISFLGVDQFGLIFNITFILAGILLLAVLQDKMGDLDTLLDAGRFQAPHFDRLWVLVIVLCLGITGVGLFPYARPTGLLHQLAALVAMLSFFGVTLSITHILPIYDREFRQASYATALVSLGVIIVHYGFRLISFSQMEITLLSVGGVWIGFFYTNTRAYIRQEEPRLITGYRERQHQQTKTRTTDQA